MTDSASLQSDTPLAPVSATDLKRVWKLIREFGSEGVGISAELISQYCEPGADAVAVFFRAAILQQLFRTGLLGDWCAGDEPAEAAFRLAADFPMEEGVQGFDPAAFVERLRNPEV